MNDEYSNDDIDAALESVEDGDQKPKQGDGGNLELWDEVDEKKTV